MKKVIQIAVALAILLVALFILSILERPYSVGSTSAHSTDPAGTHAFIRLLREEGYEVVVNNLDEPAIGESDIALVLSSESTPKISRILAEHVAKGGKAIAGSFHLGFFEPDEEPSNKFKARSITGEQMDLEAFGSKVHFNESNIKVAFWDVKEKRVEYEEPILVELWSQEGDPTPLVNLIKQEKGRILYFSDATLMSNRFLNKAQNAEFVMRNIKAFAPNGRIFVVDAASGYSFTPGYLDTVGLWFKFGMWQLGIAFLILIWRNNKRFGLPEQELKEQVGQRQFVDAVATFWRRGKRTEMAMQALKNEAIRELCEGLKLPMDTDKETLYSNLTPELIELLNQAEILSTDRKSKQRDCLDIARKLDKAIKDFLKSRR